MNPIIAIATSGLAAATTRLDVSAHNVAAASDATAFPERVDQVEIAGGGTAARVSASSPAYGPSNGPAARDTPSASIDLPSEAADQILARYTFAANAAVIRAARTMTQRLLDTVA